MEVVRNAAVYENALLLTAANVFKMLNYHLSGLYANNIFQRLRIFLKMNIYFETILIKLNVNIFRSPMKMFLVLVIK